MPADAQETHDSVELEANSSEPKKTYRFWTLRRAVICVAAAISVGVIVNQFWVSLSYQDLALNNLRASNAETLKLLVSDRIGRQYQEKIKPRANVWSRHGKIMQSVKDNDAKRMKVEADALHNDAAFKMGDLKLVSANILAKDLKPLVISGEADNTTVVTRAAIEDVLAKRDKKAQRMPVGFYWRTDAGAPVHSYIVPIGGFRVLGFLEIVTSPLGMLEGLGAYLEGDLEIVDVNGQVLMTDTFRQTEMVDNSDAGQSEESASAAGEPDPSVDAVAESIPPADNLDTVSIAVPDDAGETWVNVKLTKDVTRFTRQIATQRNQSLMVILAGVVLAWIVGWALLRTIVFNTMKRFSGAMHQISEDASDVEVPQTGDDEMGVMAGALEVLQQKAAELTDLRASEESKNRARQAAIRDQLKSVANALESELASSVQHIGGQADILVGIAGELAHSSEAVKSRSSEVAQSSQDSTGNVDQVRQTLTGLTDTMQEISGHATEGDAIARQASEATQTSTEAVEELRAASQKITEVIDIIQDIAGRTNILALNATIEAARAGEAGKGFAVVAMEVKELSQKTSEATNEISRHIEQIQSMTDGTISANVRIGETIGKLETLSVTIAEAAQKQNTAVENIMNRVQETADGTQTVISRIAEVSAESDKVEDLSGKVDQMSRGLSSGMEHLRERLGQIISDSEKDVAA